jgi:putative radical SAM enzyme (TIGR03279 family)
MMHNKRAGEVLSYIKRLADANIAMCGQIVLCRGINDGDELLRSMTDLAKFFPAMQSVSIVPAGLTKFRDGLYPLEPFSAEESAEVIRMVEGFADKLEGEIAHRVFFCADELYIKAGLPIPAEAHYEGYPQIENGVGMIRSTLEEFYCELEYIDDYLSDLTLPRTVSVATGAAAFDTVSEMAHALEERVDGLKVNVYKITNYFFGESITVAGLLTGKDMSEQLKGRELGELLLFPENALRAGGDLFLDDMSPEELSEKLGVTAMAGHNDGAQFIRDVLGV